MTGTLSELVSEGAGQGWGCRGGGQMAAKPKNKVALVAAGVLIGVVAGAMSELSRISPPPKDWISPLPPTLVHPLHPALPVCVWGEVQEGEG